jgi:hypothetical protein
VVKKPILMPSEDNAKVKHRILKPGKRFLSARARSDYAVKSKS